MRNVHIQHAPKYIQHVGLCVCLSRSTIICIQVHKCSFAVHTLLVLVEPVPSFVIDISAQVKHCPHLKNHWQENVGVVNSADKLVEAKTKCRQQFQLSLNIRTNENVEVSGNCIFFNSYSTITMCHVHIVKAIQRIYCHFAFFW